MAHKEENLAKAILGARISKILVYLIVASILSLIALWIWSGGFAAVARVAGELPSLFNRPWDLTDRLQPLGTLGLAPVPNTFSTSTDSARTEDIPATPEYTPEQLEQQYEELRRRAADSAFYGTASPYSGIVHLSKGRIEGAPAEEYLVIELGYNARGAVSISGWSLLSALSGTRYHLGTGASPFVGGVVNPLGPLVLEPGGRALVTSGHSPIGVSFRENICTGYLAQVQTFEPALANSCPRAEDVAPVTGENLARYGADCFDYIEAIPECSFPTDIPQTLSPGCRALIVNTFSHNGCVNNEKWRPSFHLGSWRVYLGSTVSLWNDSHDAIRLMDENGLTVDALVY
jgi:hypothetical protein